MPYATAARIMPEFAKTSFQVLAAPAALAPPRRGSRARVISTCLPFGSNSARAVVSITPLFHTRRPLRADSSGKIGHMRTQRIARTDTTNASTTGATADTPILTP